MNNFFLSGTIDNSLYKHLRDDAVQQADDARTFTNKLWEDTASYVDLDLQTNAKEQFHQCFWEMYLIAALLKQDFPIVKRDKRRCKRKGPDVQVGNLDAWFEAIAVTAGSGLDAVQEIDLESKDAIDVPQDKIKLRLMAAIQEKFSKYLTYRKTGIVKQGEPFIIALNAALIPHILLELTVPYIVKALFPIGHEILQFDLSMSKVVNQYHGYQKYVVKEKGTQIPLTFFEQPDSEGVSAVLYSAAHVFAYRKIGADFKLVHNPKANAPLPRGFLKCGTEYWVKDDELFWKKYSG